MIYTYVSFDNRNVHISVIHCERQVDSLQSLYFAVGQRKSSIIPRSRNRVYKFREKSDCNRISKSLKKSFRNFFLNSAISLRFVNIVVQYPSNTQLNVVEFELLPISDRTESFSRAEKRTFPAFYNSVFL